MTVQEILEELPKLSREEREKILQQIVELNRASPARLVWISRPMRARLNFDDKDALLQATEVSIYGTGLMHVRRSSFH